MKLNLCKVCNQMTNHLNDKCLKCKVMEIGLNNSKLEAKLIKGIVRLNKNLCPNCGKRMQKQIDTITGKKSKYLLGCKCMKGLIISRG